MKKKLIIVGSIALLTVGGIYFLTSSKKSSEVSYTPVAVTRGNLSQIISSTGTVKPQNRLEIKAPVAGRIDEILIKEGQFVKRGEVIAWTSSNERAALMDAVRTQGDQEIKKWEELYKPTPVIAPISGTVIAKSVEAGQSFATTDAIFVMADRLTVKAQVDETDIASIQLKQNAEIILDAYPEHSIKGEVVKIAYDSTLTNNVTTYEVDILPIDAPEFLRSGMTSTVNVVVKSLDNILLLPAGAITHGPQGTTVKAENRMIPVKLGLEQSGQVQILEGLTEGQTVMMPEMNLKAAPSAGGSPFMPGRPRGKK